VLGLRLTNRFGNSWATVDAGKGLTIGLHPASPGYPAPGTKGSMMLGLEIDEPIAGMVARLSERRSDERLDFTGRAGEFRSSGRSRWQ
jgi:hypothetical protein